MARNKRKDARTSHGLAGKETVFSFLHCQTDRFWRQSLHLTPERRCTDGDIMNFDGHCRNAYKEPKAPAVFNSLNHLQKYADYE